MKIALVIERFDRRLGGAAQWTHQLAQWLLLQGCQVHILAREFGTAELSLAIEPHFLPGGRSPFSFAVAVEHVLPKISPDITHDMGASWSGNVFQPHYGSKFANRERNNARRPKWQQGIRKQVIRQLPRYQHIDQFVARQYASHQRIYVALSKMVACDFQRYHGVPPHLIQVVRNGVDTERFSPKSCAQHRSRIRTDLKISDHEVVLLFVAHNFQLKGLPNLLRSHRTLIQQGYPVRLVVCGGRPLREPSPKTDFDESVLMLGPVEDTVPFYAAADICVHPTYYDACSLVVLEAMACGLPTVTTRWNGAAELIANGREGFVIPNANDTDLLVQHLMTLVDPDYRKTMGLEARQLMENHSMDHNFQQFWKIYEQFLAARSRAA